MSASNTRFVALGELLELCDERNAKGLYGMDDVMGMTITKEVIPTKADVKDADLSKYLVVKPNEFVYNPRTHGKRIGLGYNKTDEPFLISWNNTAFKIKDLSILNPDYLYMYLNRIEWDRNACFRSWGSSTEVFSWAEFCLMTIPLPSIDTQRELVAVYKGLLSLAETNEALLRPLSEACKASVVDCQRKYDSVPLGENIQEYDERNSSGENLPFLGLNKDKCFMPTVADTNGLDNRKYKVIRAGKFAFSGMQTGRDICIRIGLYTDSNPGVISPAYTTFAMKPDSKLQPEYVMMYFKRFEMDRYGAFLSDSSVRSNLDWDRFNEIQIPLPPEDVQQSIVNLYNCYEEAKQIATLARERLKIICPALVQKAAHSA